VNYALWLHVNHYADRMGGNGKRRRLCIVETLSGCEPVDSIAACLEHEIKCICC
jgi:hypothetical protein